MSLNIVSLWLRNFRASGCCLPFFFAKLTNLMDGLVVLLPHFCDKSEQPETQGRDFLNIIAALCWKWPYFTVPSTPRKPASSKPCSIECSLAQSLSTTPPFPHRKVRYLNWATDSRVVFAFFLGGWKSLKSQSRFSCPAILVTTTGSCYTVDCSKNVTVLLRDAWQLCDVMIQAS